MHAVSQIVERNIHRLDHSDTGLWINPGMDVSWRKAKTRCTSLKLFSQDYAAYLFQQQTGADIEFSAFPQVSETKYNWIMINLPRQKALLAMMLDCAAALLASDGVLWLAGENKAGIKSADKLLNNHFRQVRKLDNARHCSLYEARGSLGQEPFRPLDYRQQWTLEHAGTRINVISYPGVFAHGRLDSGTQLLLQALTELEPGGDVLDFGCGSGVLGACVAATEPQADVCLLDSSAIALRASGETLAANRLKASLLPSDGLSELTGSFDFIVSNPPIHAGVKTDNQMSMRLLESVWSHIKPAGSLVLVANVHLPYERWLSGIFDRCFELIANNSFKVILAKK